MLLSDLQPGQKGVIIKILGHSAFRKRVMEMGFVKGRIVHVVLNAPLQDPIKYSIMGYEVSLRRAEADLIEVAVEGKPDINLEESNVHELNINEKDTTENTGREKVINVALIGNPNCGKTSLFNLVSGAHEHVGNYAGVTVGAKEGSIKYKGYRINIVDLPGTYSLSAYSPEEQYVVRYLRKETPDVIINVVVASNLQRNLFLTTELIDMNRSMVIALNMYDELKKQNIKLDTDLLGKMLGVPIVPTVASTGMGVHELLNKVIETFEDRAKEVRHIHVNLRPEVEAGVSVLNKVFKQLPEISGHFSPRYIAIKFLQHDPEVEGMLKEFPQYPEWRELRNKEEKRIEDALGDDVQAIVSAEKYGFIEGALAETMQKDGKPENKTTDIIDAFVTNKLFGFPIFLCVMWLMFWATFVVGAYPMEWIEKLVSLLSNLVSANMPDGPFKDLLLDGVIGGVGSVIVFLPNILILYAFISFMEDSGYMARVAFIMDKLMHRLGLHGKSFIPLVMGFGCGVPAIMSTRIIESKSSRLITILIIPFISCSARIPIYVLLVGCFFDGNPWVFVFLYVLGMIVAVLTARMLRKFWFHEDETPFVMELPPYRIPTAKATMRGMWSKASQYLKKMGGLILVASAIIWALSYFPRVSENEVPAQYIADCHRELVTIDKSKADTISHEQEMELITTQYQQQNSILGVTGRFIQPAVEPLGFDWKATVSLIAGLPAKEIVVSTLGVLYTGEGDDSTLLQKRLETPSPISNKAPFNKASALAFMVFVLIYFPCIATMIAIVKESGSWLYGLFSLCYNTLLAWGLAWITYRITLWFI